jgi:hypothetical protein
MEHQVVVAEFVEKIFRTAMEAEFPGQEVSEFEVRAGSIGVQVH